MFLINICKLLMSKLQEKPFRPQKRTSSTSKNEIYKLIKSKFVGNFCPPGSESNPYPDPDPVRCKMVSCIREPLSSHHHSSEIWKRCQLFQSWDKVSCLDCRETKVTRIFFCIPKLGFFNRIFRSYAPTSIRYLPVCSGQVKEIVSLSLQ